MKRPLMVVGCVNDCLVEMMKIKLARMVHTKQ